MSSLELHSEWNYASCNEGGTENSTSWENITCQVLDCDGIWSIQSLGHWKAKEKNGCLQCHVKLWMHLADELNIGSFNQEERGFEVFCRTLSSIGNAAVLLFLDIGLWNYAVFCKSSEGEGEVLKWKGCVSMAIIGLFELSDLWNVAFSHLAAPFGEIRVT